MNLKLVPEEIKKEADKADLVKLSEQQKPVDVAH